MPLEMINACCFGNKLKKKNNLQCDLPFMWVFEEVDYSSSALTVE